MANKQFTLNLATVSCLAFLLGASSLHVATAAKSAPKAGTLAFQGSTAASLGKSATLLPSGDWLLLGGTGESGEPSNEAALRDQVTGTVTPLPSGLQFARAWHSATVLPDGSVLVLGGIGSDGKVVIPAELFHPETQAFELLASAPTPRASHTATLLTDGSLLIAGGVAMDGRPLHSLELWDFRTKLSSPAGAGVTVFRRDHAAFLLPDGRVLFAGGKDDKGNVLTVAEIYDPQSGSSSVAQDSTGLLQAAAGMTEVRATSPEDGAVNVAVDAFISLRFSRAVSMRSIGSQTVIMNGPEGSIDATVIAAEGGMLAFLTPRSSLQPGSVYTVQLSGAVDTNNANVAFFQFSFTTAGQPVQPPAKPPAPTVKNDKAPSVDLRSLPPLQAPPGETALAGQVLRIDGQPLHHVTLQIDSQRAFSDGTGRFLLTRITAGHHSLLVLANTANTSTNSYGIYEIGVDIKANQTNVLDYTIWQTPLDTAHTVNIPSPTLTETVVRTPLLPGLELHIPANTVITGYDGKTVTQINITPIPLDRPPFPLPKVQVPIYFTIQPGSAYIKVLNASGPKGAQLYYPNTYHAQPGTAFNFWNYDPDQRGWYIYGRGKVSADASQIIPGPGVLIYEFTGAMVAGKNLAPPNGPPPGGHSPDGDPVDLSTGLFVYSQTDLFLPDTIPIALTRTYRPGDLISHAFGIGTTHPYDMFIVGDPVNYSFTDLILADGGRVHFPRVSPGTSYVGAAFTSTTTPSGYYGASINFNGGGWTLSTKDGSVIQFGDSFGATAPQQAAAISMTDRNGNSLTFKRDANSGNLNQIISPNGRWIQFTYDSGNRVIQAQDNIGRIVKYAYDAGGRLQQVTDANGGVTKYAYDSNNNMIGITDPNGNLYIQNLYDGNNRIIQQTMGDGAIYTFSYTVDSNNIVTQTTVTDPLGNQRNSTFNSAGYTTGTTLATGTPQQQTFIYNRDPNTNLLLSFVDPISRKTTYNYDPMGNISSVTALDGTSNAVTASATYDSVFSNPLTISDLSGRTTQASYDSFGNLTGVINPQQSQTTFTYTSAGQLLSTADSSGNTTQMTYSGPDLVGVTDSMGNTTSRFYDGVGRLISLTSPLGQTWRYTYSPGNQLLQEIDPQGGTTSYTYDANGNVLSIIDARENKTSYTYDSMDRRLSRTDALGRTTSYQYDAGGNLVGITNRSGSVTAIKYDALYRKSFVGFGGSGGAGNYESTISYSYDAANHLTQMVDSSSGTISLTHDIMDRITSEVTPLGSVSYTYDPAGHRTGMQVAGQPSVLYGYDSGGRLTQITQGTSTVTIGYDANNRRNMLSLPNGIVIQYVYDGVSRLLGITYKLGNNTLGSLSYVYDANGRRVQQAGASAKTGIPQPVASAVYDAANELTAWNGSTFSYNANGSLIGDGVNTYTWNARNQLTAVGSTTFQYDAFGRRIQNAAGAQLLYDGFTPVQELSGTTVVANLLTGGLGEIFSRTDASGTFTPLTDSLGSTFALADSSGTPQTQFTYDPFGNTTASGASNSATAQYTGQQNDGNGLYYYRARYYNPLLGRFISEDPIGFVAGMNVYAYVGGNPIGFSDPTGMSKAPGGMNPNGNQSPSNQDQSPNRHPNLKRQVCTWVPDGRVVGVSGSVGLIANATGSLEMVYNYNTGEVSLFAAGGVFAGWNPGPSGTLFGGFIAGLGNSNAHYAGPFTTAFGGGGGLSGSVAASNQGGVPWNLSSPNSQPPGQLVATVGVTASVGDFTGFGGVSDTAYSPPLTLGYMPPAPPSLQDPASLIDNALYWFRQWCNSD